MVFASALARKRTPAQGKELSVPFKLSMSLKLSIKWFPEIEPKTLHSAVLQDSPLLQSSASAGTEKDGHLSGVTPLHVSALQSVPATVWFLQYDPIHLRP